MHTPLRAPLPSPRRFGAIALGLLLLAACGQEGAAGGGSGLVILPDESPLAPGVLTRDPRPYFHDFGLIPDGDTVEHVFRIRNDEPREVAITRVDPGCGCSVAALRVVHPDGRLEVGESTRSRAETLLRVPSGSVAELEVRIDTRDLVTKNTHKLVTIRVATDSPGAYFLNFEVHLYVEKPFAAVPETLAFGDVSESGGGRARVEVVPAGTAVHELGALAPPPEGMAVDVLKELRAGRPVWVVEARLDPPLVRGALRGVLRFATQEPGGANGREFELPYSANVVGDLIADPQRLVFRGTSPGAEGSADLASLLAGQRLRVTGVELPEAHRPYLAASAVALDPDDAGTSPRWRITLTQRAPEPAGEILSGVLSVHLADPQNPSYALPYVVHPR